MPREVDDAALKRLLELQDEDSAIRRLEHQRDALPQAQRLAHVSDQLEELHSDLAIARKQADEAAREQDRMEGEIGMVERKTEKEQQRLYSGGVSNPKELSALQAEVQMLNNKKSAMEDELLEVMERRERVTETLQRIEQEAAEVSKVKDELSTKVAQITADIEAQLQAHRGGRDQLAAQIPEDLLALYDRLRGQKGGVGAAALRDGTCEGCHTKLPAKEVERVRAEGGLQRCDHCRRILVAV